MPLAASRAQWRYLVATAGIGLSAALVAGCSGSSSSGPTAATSSMTPGATASASASGSPDVGGSAAPTSTPAGPPPPPLTFHGVSHGAWLWVRRIGRNAGYVAQVTYDAGSRTVLASFKPGTTATDLRNFKSLVRQAEQLAAKGKEPSASSPAPGHGVKHHRRVHHRRHRNQTLTQSPTPSAFPTSPHHSHPPPHASVSPSPSPSSTATH